MVEHDFATVNQIDMDMETKAGKPSEDLFFSSIAGEPRVSLSRHQKPPWSSSCFIIFSITTKPQQRWTSQAGVKCLDLTQPNWESTRENGNREVSFEMLDPYGSLCSHFNSQGQSHQLHNQFKTTKGPTQSGLSWKSQNVKPPQIFHFNGMFPL